MLLGLHLMFISIITSANKVPVVLCTGAKNTGKSTVNRMLVNAAFKRYC